jgi:hypothetical protein
VSFLFFGSMGYTVVFDDNILGLGGPEELNMVVREQFSSLETLNQYLAGFDDWELEAHNLRVERSDYGYDPVVPF